MPSLAVLSHVRRHLQIAMLIALGTLAGAIAQPGLSAETPAGTNAQDPAPAGSGASAPAPAASGGAKIESAGDGSDGADAKRDATDPKRVEGHAKRVDDAAAAREPSRHGVVVLLPLQQSAFARAADAVRRGFLAGAQVDKADDSISVIPYADGGLDGAIEAARFADPEWIVGPLTRDDVNQLVRQSDSLPPVLALNQPDDPAQLPAHVYTFSLALESEARQVAVQMRADGFASAAVLMGSGALQRRVASAFEAEWRGQGGTLTGRFTVGSGIADSAAARRLREEVRKTNPDAIFLALDATEAQRVRPALGPARIYATSQVYEGQDETLLRDLDGVRFFAMPCIVDPAASLCDLYPREGTAGATLDRLYAFGIDAYRLVSALRANADRDNVTLEGVTGRIALSGPQQFTRGGVLTEIRQGRLVPLEQR